MSKELENGQVVLTYDEAVARLDVRQHSDGERYVHTILEAGPILLGADWTEERVLELLREADGREDEHVRIQETGSEAQSMGHGLAVSTDAHGNVFIAAKGPPDGH